MSKIFYDHLLDLEKLDKKIKEVASSQEEREEIWGLVDEIIHHRALGCILDRLSPEHHPEFLEMFHDHPHDEDLLFSYLEEKIDKNIRELLRIEMGDLAIELLEDTKNTPQR